MSLTVPDNIPADVLAAIQKHLDALSDADATGGGIRFFGAFVVNQQQGLVLHGDFPSHMGGPLTHTIGAGLLRELVTSGSDCNCPDCAQVRATTAQAKTKARKPEPSFMERLFGVRK